MGKDRGDFSKLCRANCLADSLYKSSSNRKIPAKLIAKVKGEREHFLPRKLCKPQSCRGLKTTQKQRPTFHLRNCDHMLGRKHALKYSLSTTQSPSPELKCIVQPPVTASNKVVGNEPALLPLICFSILCCLLEELDLTLPKVSHSGNWQIRGTPKSSCLRLAAGFTSFSLSSDLPSTQRPILICAKEHTSRMYVCIGTFG